MWAGTAPWTVVKVSRRPAARRTPLLPVVVLVLGALLAACSTGAGDPGSASSTPPTSTPPTGSSGASGEGEPTGTPSSAPAPEDTVRVVTVGDIACAPGSEVTETRCHHEDTAELAASMDPDEVIALGDLQYEVGALDAFLEVWDASWGQFREIVLPVPGNHEYGTGNADDYLKFFGTSNYYVQRLGDWRVYLLDSNCWGPECDEQAQWLAEDAAAHPSTCSLAAMHHPRFSSGSQHGSQEQIQPLWQAAVANGVDVVLAGHEHHYERFARLGTDGRLGAVPSARSFIVGTGGRSLYDVDDPIEGSEVLFNEDFGVMELTLAPQSYSWRFVTIGGEVVDEGTDDCTDLPG